MFSTVLESSSFRAHRKTQATQKIQRTQENQKTQKIQRTQETQKTQKIQNLYILTSTTKFFDGIGKRTVYGIEVKSSSIKGSVEDISSNKDIVVSLLQKLAKEQCSPIHLMDIVEDFLVSQGI